MGLGMGCRLIDFNCIYFYLLLLYKKIGGLGGGGGKGGGFELKPENFLLQGL